MEQGQDQLLQSMGDIFMDLANDKPFLKMAINGFAGDGKTFTSAQNAIGVHKLVRSTKPIAIFDTEQAAKALVPEFERAGISARISKSRSLTTLNQVIRGCEAGFADVLMIDSITHVYEDFLSSYMQEKRKSRLEFQDWAYIKPRWKEMFSTPFVKANVHIIFTGRAGYEYENEKNEDTGKREIYKSGIKMKAEGETAFEPDILVLMEKFEKLIGDNKKVYRTAFIQKDRSNTIDGLTLNADGNLPGPSFEMFYPAISALLNGTIRAYTGLDLPNSFQTWEDNFGQLARRREILIGEIEGNFQLMKLGSKVEDKSIKAWLIKGLWGCVSADGLKNIHPDALENGLKILNQYAEIYNNYMTEIYESGNNPDAKVVARLYNDLVAKGTTQTETTQKAAVTDPAKMEMEHAGLQVNMDGTPTQEKQKKETAKERKVREEKEYAEKLAEYTTKLQACTTPGELDAMRQKEYEPFLKSTLPIYMELREKLRPADKQNPLVTVTEATAEVLPNGDLGEIKGSIAPVAEPDAPSTTNVAEPSRKNDALYVQFDAIRSQLTPDEITGDIDFNPMLTFMTDNASYIGSQNPKPEYDADFRNYVIPFLKDLGYTEWMKSRVTKKV